MRRRLRLSLEAALRRQDADPRDARRRALQLTRRGKRQFELLRFALDEARAAFQEVFREISCDLSAKANLAVDALDRATLLSRVRLAQA